MTGARRPPTPLLLVIMAGLAVLAVLAASEGTGGQTNPPTLGDGDWTVRDTTVLQDWGVIMLRGDLRVTAGGSLTLSNTTLLFVNADSGEHGLTVDGGSTLRVLRGSTLGSSRPGVAWTCAVEAGCHLEILDSRVEECGMPIFGFRPDWTKVAFYVGTSDARVENTSFSGGMAGLYFERGVHAMPVRNCTFENVYGLISFGTWVEDCTFRDQTLFGVVFHGGESGLIARCRFENVFATCLQVGYEYFEPYELHNATARAIDCTFVRSTRGIRVLPESTATIERCTVNGMEREGLDVASGATVRLFDGDFSNTSQAILCHEGSSTSWWIRDHAMVLGGNVTLTGGIRMDTYSELELLEIRNLTLLGRTVGSVDIVLMDHSRLTLVNGSIEVPLWNATPESWKKPRLLAPRSSVRFEGVGITALEFPVYIEDFTCIRSNLVLGSWVLGRAWIEDCYLLYGLRTLEDGLVLGSNTSSEESWLVDCHLLGPSETQHMFKLRQGTVHSVDFLHDLDDLVESDTMRWDVPEGQKAVLEASWSLRAYVHWQNQQPIAGTEVVMRDPRGVEYTSTTDPSGYTPVRVVLTERVSSDGTQEAFLPLELSTEVSGLVGRATLEMVEQPLTVDIPVLDDVPPVLLVDQGGSLATNRTQLVLTGTARDSHSGISFLEASLLPNDFVRLEIDPLTGRFEVWYELKEVFSRVVLRLYDNVGNRRVHSVEVFFSTLSPFLLIDEPVSGSYVSSPLLFVVGQTEANATVEAGGRLTVTDNGTFRIPVDLAEGLNVIHVRATSRAGNRNATSIEVFLDSVAPKLQVTTPASSPHRTNVARQEIRGITEAGAQVLVNGVPIGTRTDGSFSANVSLDEGAKRVVVAAMDLAGNQVETELVFLLDSTPPTLVVLLEGVDATQFTGEGVLRTAALKLVMTVVTEEGVKLEVDGSQVEILGTSASLDLEPPVGPSDVTVRAEDDAGNFVTFGPIHIEVDRTPPRLNLSPDLPDRTEEALFLLIGSTEPNVTVRVNGAVLNTDLQGKFMRNFLLSEGSNRLVVIAEDRYGQTTQAIHEVVMTPSEPPPAEGPDSLLPLLLALTVAVLVVEAVALEAWWRRRGGRPGGATDREPTGRQRP